MKKILSILLYITIWVHPTQLAHGQPANQKIFLLFNQPEYIGGDTAFFRGQLTTNDFKPVSGKKIVNLKLLKSPDEVLLFNRFLFQNGICSGQLYLPKQLASDVYTLIAYTDENPTVGFQAPLVVSNEKETLIDDQHKTLLFPFDSTSSENSAIHVSIEMERHEYEPRQLVNVQITVTDSANKPLQADHVISVVHQDLFQNASWQNILQQGKLNVISLPGQPDFTYSRSNKKFPSYFKGRVSLDSIAQQLRDSILITFYFAKSDFVYGLYADEKGNFEFPLFKEFPDEEIFYLLSRKGFLLDKARIVTDQDNHVRVDAIQNKKNDKNDPYYKLARERALTAQSYNYYLEAKHENTEETDDWMETDYEVNVTNFEPFIDVKEMLSNIIQTVRYSVRKNGEIVRVFLKDEAMFGRRDPLYIINGIMTDDTQYFLTLDPNRIEKIGVLRSKATLARFGELGKNGIILIRTKASVEDVKGDKILFIRGISKPNKFYSLQYKTDLQLNSKLPDLRSTLYWNPKLTAEKGIAKFSFYTGDAIGTFKIRVNGIAEGNLFYSKELTFEVRREVQ